MFTSYGGIGVVMKIIAKAYTGKSGAASNGAGGKGTEGI